MAENLLHRNLLFVSGKGGVGKTSISKAIAQAHSRQGRRTLWVCIEDPLRSPGQLIQKNPHLWELNIESSLAFEEFVSLKLPIPGLAKLFFRNKLIKYLAKASPGIHELVLLGKIWFERNNYRHVVVDMPATGHGLAMFQSIYNFTRLFSGGTVRKETDAMLASFRDKEIAGTLIVALPEDMPLRESLELRDYWCSMFPENPPGFLLNKRFPYPAKTLEENPLDWQNPIAKNSWEYIERRACREKYNLNLWKDLEYPTVEWVPGSGSISEILAGKLPI